VIDYRLLLASLVLILLPWTGANGAKPLTPLVSNPWLLCVPDPLAEFATQPLGSATANLPIEINADSGDSTRETSVARGNVFIKQGNQQLHAPEVTLDRQKNYFTANQGLIYGSPDLVISGKQGGYHANDKTGWFSDAQYSLPKRHAEGYSDRIDFQHESQTSQLQQATYSTCNRGDEFWQLHMPKLELDQQAGRGVARHVTLSMGSVPVFYWNYLSFPIDERRQSGFLMPTYAYSTTNGFDLRIPFYWNIAPNQDMTFAPRLLTQRGLMLTDEYRFLLPSSQGQVNVEYLPNDRQYQDKDRLGLFVQAKANPWPQFYQDLQYQYVSDDDYLKNFGNHLRLLTQTYLERTLDNRYQSDNWNFLTRLQQFQILDERYFTGNNDPYDRLPQLLFNGDWLHPGSGLEFGLNNEAVNFVRGRSTQGERLDLWPALSLPLQQPYGFLVPKVSYRATAYELRDLDAPKNINPTLTNDAPSRQAPVASTDGGLFFERPLEWPWGDNRAATLTLEPRLFYLYVPYRQQNNLPHFDTTALFNRSYPWLFLDNRFAGADRLGDANQLSTAVSSRLLNAADGSEKAVFRFGWINYFRDRKVTLYPTDPVQTDRTSPLIAETTINLIPKVSLTSYLHWDSNEILRGGTGIYYRPGEGRLLNFSYGYSQSEPEYQSSLIKQLDISGLWTFNERWRAVGRWNYSLIDARNIQMLAGFEYEECCWALRLLATQYRNQPQDPAKNAVILELELKGLSSVGDAKLTQFLSKEIPGYQPRTARASAFSQ